LARLDYNVTERIRVFGHYIKDISNAVIPYGTWVLGINPPIASISEPIPGNSLAGGMTYMISPTMTNEFNLGYTNNSINIFAPNNGLSQKTLMGSNPLPVLYPDAVQGDYLPQVGFGGNYHYRSHRQCDEGLAEPCHQGRLLYAAQPEGSDVLRSLQRQLQLRRPGWSHGG
jgi:hypothetical protein